MFNEFILDEYSIFIPLIQFHLHLISFHQRFPHHLHDIFSKFSKKHPAPARCSVKNIQFLPAYIFNVANIIFLISKYYFFDYYDTVLPGWILLSTSYITYFFLRRISLSFAPTNISESSATYFLCQRDSSYEA